MKYHLPDELATKALAESLYDALPGCLAGWTMLLSGELGAGKSTFARALIQRAGHSGAVPSPTYTLVEPYEIASGRIYHIDLYRVSDAEELRYLGWNELDDGFRLVEWPDRSPGLREEADLALCIAYAGNARDAEFAALSDRGAAVLSSLASPDSKD